MAYRRGECASCYGKEYRAQHAERIKARRRAFYAANKEMFRKQKAASYQRHKEKRLAKQKEYYAANKGARTAYNKWWAKQNREFVRQYMLEYRHSDKPGAARLRLKQREYVKKHRETNSKAAEAHRARQARRRAAGAQTELVTISQALFEHDALCHLCGAPIELQEAELDHIIPLAAGGRHVRENLAPAHARCNRIKRGLHPDELPLHIQRKFHQELQKRMPPPNWPMT